MIQDATRFTMDLPTSLPRTLSGTTKLMVTQCSMRHLYDLPTSHPQKQTLISTAKNMERRRCNHQALEKPLSTLECLSSVIDPKSTHTEADLVNKFNYVIAVQDEDVRRWCRSVRGVPLVYVKRSVMVMEPMAKGSTKIREGSERVKFKSGLRETVGSVLGKRKNGPEHLVEGPKGDEEDTAIKDEGVKKKRKRGPKEPNPLSVKKPKSIHQQGGTTHAPILTVMRATVDQESASPEAISAIEGGAPPKSTRRRKRKHKPKDSGYGQPMVVSIED